MTHIYKLDMLLFQRSIFHRRGDQSDHPIDPRIMELLSSVVQENHEESLHHRAFQEKLLQNKRVIMESQDLLAERQAVLEERQEQLLQYITQLIAFREQPSSSSALPPSPPPPLVLPEWQPAPSVAEQPIAPPTVPEDEQHHMIKRGVFVSPSIFFSH